VRGERERGHADAVVERLGGVRGPGSAGAAERPSGATGSPARMPRRAAAAAKRRRCRRAPCRPDTA
jgi:hypothetical protein